MKLPSLKLVAFVAILAFILWQFLSVRSIHQQLRNTRDEFRNVIRVAGFDASLQASDGKADALELPPLKSANEFQASLAEVGDSPKAIQLAEKLGVLDSWLVQVADEPKVRDLKTEQLKRLRRVVKEELGALQKTALESPTGNDAIQRHSEAGRLLSLYPMSEESDVIEEAKALSAAQMALAARIEILRRQRYNQWAVQQIEEAVNFYNANVSRFNPFADNAILIDSMVRCLGPIDPATLEPVVLDLYNYIIDRTKGSLSEQNKLQLAKRLTDPSISRKTIGEF